MWSNISENGSLSLGLAVIIVGLLVISAVLVVGGDTPEPVEVNTSAGTNELLVQAFDRLETTDYRRTVSYNTSEYNKPVRAYYYEVSNSNQRREKGFVNSTDGSHIRKAYANDVMKWVRTSPSEWSTTVDHHEWDFRRFTGFTPKVDGLSEANATVRKRSAEEIIVEIPNGSSVSRVGNSPNRSERWVFTIDSQTGNVIEDEKWLTHPDGNVTLSRNEYEYGITIERPENIPFSLEEQYYRFLAMDLYEKIGLIGGPMLILVGCGVIYREYPLHRKIG